jgi:hypothetical protein
LKHYVKFNRHCDPVRQLPERGNLFIVIIFLVLLSSAALATVVTVKQDGSGNFTTIQAGINAASNGDTVLVWPGTYFENIDYHSKNITVASLYFTTGNLNYINTTIIDGASNGSCVYISHIIGDDATLCGFKIQHGSGNSSLIYSGGGILIVTSTIAISHCIIQDNHCLFGGGILCYFSNVHLIGTVVKNNSALIEAGGIIISNECDFIFDTIQKNSVYLNYSPVGCDITKTISLEEQHIVLDTASVLSPDQFFFYSHDIDGNPLNNLTWEIDHGKIEQVNADLYVSINGSNENSGLTPLDPLKTVAFAMSKIVSDSINPKTIYLGSGTYSHATGQIFPVYQRNYTSLVGSGVENTIIDAELTYPLYNSESRMKSYSIKEISFINGNDNNYDSYGLYGGFEIVHCDNVYFQNISISGTTGYLSSALTSRASEINIYGLSVYDNSGGFPVVLSNTSDIFREIHIVNSFISNNGPGGDNWGGGLLIGGSYSNPDNNSTKLVNVQINENIKTFDQGAGNFGTSGLNCADYAKVDVINTSIANNIVTNPVPGGQVYATEGAEINFYNSIVYGTENYEIFLGEGTSTSDIATVNISSTDVKGGEENIQNWNNIHILNWLDGNIDEDPLWEGGEPFNYALQPGSPCINAGVPMYEAGMDYPYIKEENGKYVLYMLDGDTVTLPSTDLAGNPRISGGRIDMGAYEWQDTLTGSSKEKGKSEKLKVKVYPNPFTSNTFISFTTSKDHQINLEVVNLQGEIVRRITSARYPAGEYRLVWNGQDDSGFEVKPGYYFICLYSDGRLDSTVSVTKAGR